MKVIFLDIDGVLNVIPTKQDEHGCVFHEHLVKNLEWIIKETSAKLVISSSWRLDGLDAMKAIWKDRNYYGEIIDITPLGTIDNIRGDEIQVWLDNNNIENYVIIDDDTDFWESQMNNFVQTSDNIDHEDCVDIGYGLTRKCAEKAIKILNNGR